METKQEILNINGISTHTYQLGNQSLSSKTIVIIPGNPGLGGFYIPFAHELYNLFNENISILVISQAGHSPPLKHCFTLNEQIEHKLQAIKQLVPNNSNHQLILIGHSIGAYMVLNMLDKLENKLNRAFLLFPTIERMGESDAGQRFVRLYPILIYLLPFLCFITNILLPFDWLKRKIISYYFSQSPLNDREILIDTVLYDLLNPLAIKNLLQMANEEMSVVKKRNDEIIKRFLNKLTFYYGTNDHWVPKEIAKQMKEIYPNGDIIECTNSYMHAFVLKHSKQLARIVFDRID
ncbi:unnamed protein product [Adineta steineri]|uniref:Lipid droplet-associated hydrolase n=1 Tax=Adineta steineri TaxID=433720 RepID=A0A819C6X0_9BILA|nr:unnamed protein product [Adineta steineri]CAF1355712.1 unnamed protein product [Adineta steineri]CAF3806722.1 unnamed protein product [Adineta steineri]